MPDQHTFSRRQMLKYSAAAGLAATVPAASPRVARAVTKQGQTCRNIIFMVADGMSPGVPALAEAFSQLIRGRSTHWHRLSRDPAVTCGDFDMASLNSLVTDSAAAASSWASGSRVNNWAVNTLPDGTALTPIGVLAQRSGRRVGVVSTTRITHATPAGFLASVESRNQEDQIAPQYLNVADVILGGGTRHFDPDIRTDQRDLLNEFKQQDYAICRSRDRLGNIGRSERVLGLFADNHLPYTIDRNRDALLQAQVPTLAEMAAAAIALLSHSPNGYLLQIEGGRVDHAAHNNDAAAMLWDQLAFDDAIGMVMEIAQADRNTLVIITSDHGCGNPGLNGIGRHYEQSTDHFERLAQASASLEAMQEQWTADSLQGKASDAAAMVELLKWGTSIEIEQREAAIILDVLSGKSAPEINALEANVYGVVAQILGNHTGIGWTGIAHTSDWMPCLAFGPGSDRFHGLLRNTDAFAHMTALWNIEHRNPQAAKRPNVQVSYQALRSELRTRNSERGTLLTPHT